MLAAVGDLLEDVVVSPTTEINVAADTDARIVRRRGGSAANVAATAAHLGRPARFLGQVGADAMGASLVDQLATVGVDTGHVRRAGSTGAIVVLLDQFGERTMLTDRRACVGLDRPERAWLDGVSVLHIPLYSLAEAPLADTTFTLVDWCHDADIDLSIDLSSTTAIDALGIRRVEEVLTRLRPQVVLANADEARRLRIDGPVAGAVTVVKRGADPAVMFHRDDRAEIPATLLGDVGDTTGAGDAFAAGFLTADFRDDPVEACRAGHGAAASALSSPSGASGL